MFENFTAILSDTRVGSTALGTGLDNGKTAFFLGEILYPEENETGKHLYRFALGLDYAAALKDKMVVYSFLDSYFSSSEWDRQCHYYFDIKYHDLGIFPAHPFALGSRPLLLSYLVDRQFHIMHLNRRNKLAATLSQEVAKASGLFHSNQERAGLDGEIQLSVAEVAANVIGRGNAHQSVKNWLRGYDKVLDLEYEALLIDEVKFDLETFLREKWKISDASFTPHLSRLSASGRVRIKNADEIENRLIELNVGGDLKAALRPYKN